MHATVIQRRRRRRAQRGLTMLEMMIVIAIIGLVMGLIVVPAVMGNRERASKDIAKLAVMKLANEAYPQWALANPSQRCPADAKTLGAELGNSMIDPWGTPYKVLCGGELPAGAKHIAVVSFGPDRVESTDDDIRSW